MVRLNASMVGRRHRLGEGTASNTRQPQCNEVQRARYWGAERVGSCQGPEITESELWGIRKLTAAPWATWVAKSTPGFWGHHTMNNLRYTDGVCYQQAILLARSRPLKLGAWTASATAAGP